MLNESVKLPKGTAETIGYYRKNNMSNIDIILRKAEGRVNEMGLNRENLAKVDFDTLLQALVNGYEVEETPEDKVREYYKEQRMTKGADQDSTDHAIKKVLDWLNIKIEGVNA